MKSKIKFEGQILLSAIVYNIPVLLTHLIYPTPYTVLIDFFGVNSYSNVYLIFSVDFLIVLIQMIFMYFSFENQSNESSDNENNEEEVF
jgi:uncharacterized membrane protein